MKTVLVMKIVLVTALTKKNGNLQEKAEIYFSGVRKFYIDIALMVII